MRPYVLVTPTHRRRHVERENQRKHSLVETYDGPDFDELGAPGENAELLLDYRVINIGIAGPGRLSYRKIKVSLHLDKRVEEGLRHHHVIVGHEHVVVLGEINSLEQPVHDPEFRNLLQ